LQQIKNVDVYLSKQKNKNKMEILREEQGYKIKFNGSSTYTVVDENGTCLLACNTLRKANNRLKRILGNK